MTVALKEFVRLYYRTIGGPHAKTLAGKLKGEDWITELSSHPGVSPLAYRCKHDFWRANLAVNLLRKINTPGDSDARRIAAEEAFLGGEAHNKITNTKLSRLGKMLRNEILWPSDRTFAFGGVVLEWRREMRRVLGPLPDTLRPLFSGGATTEHGGKRKTIPDKLSSSPGFYNDPVSHLLHEHLFGNTVLGSRAPLIVPGNEFFTVPKNARTDRGCAKEATGALAGQLAIGAYLKMRHKIYYKVDLPDVPDFHKSLAQEASMTGQYATIDLANASNSLSRELIKLIVPDEWYQLLNSLRAQRTKIRGTWHELEMFSSMGNGFTFELETLVFKTLGEVLCSGFVSVFGDDIIIDAQVAPLMIEALRYFGFETNAEKTFWQGSFRESCGGDYFDGKLVRPVFVTEVPSKPQHWVALANKLFRAGLEGTPPWRHCIEQLPMDWRVFGPEFLGDLAITTSAPEPVWRVNPHSKQAKPYWKYKRPFWPTISITKHFTYEVALAALCYGVRRQMPLPVDPSFKTDWILAYGAGGDQLALIKRYTKQFGTGRALGA